MTVILDYWNKTDSCRSWITRNLRNKGAERVEAWYFITPEEISMEWFFTREPERLKKVVLESEKNYSEEVKERRQSDFEKFVKGLYRNDYRQFHKCNIILDNHFDTAHTINPINLANTNDLLGMDIL